MTQIFDASNHVAIRNGGGGDKDINKCTTNGRPQHMYRCCAGVKNAGVMPASRHVFISSGRRTSSGGLSLIARQATDPAAAARKLREGSPEQLLKYGASTDHIQGKMQEAVGSPRLFHQRKQAVNQN